MARIKAMLASEPVEMTLPLPPTAAVTFVTSRRILGLGLLVAANCLILGFAEWSLSFFLPLDGTTWTFFWVRLFSNMCEGVVIAQFLLIGFWCALAPERLVLRVLLGILVTAVLLLEIYGLFFWMLGSSLTYGVSAVQAGNYCGQAVIAFLLLRALRPWCGWRLSWDGAPRFPASRQFRILDLMAWTAAVATPLGLLQTLYGPQARGQAVYTIANFVTILPITIPLFRWAIHPERKTRWLIGLLLWGAVWPVCLVLLFNFGYLFYGGAGLPFWKDSLMMFAIWSTYYLPMVLVFTGNLLALGKIGLRPAAKSAPVTP